MARIVVIGAGVGGLAAAARLAAAGHHVRVLERNPSPGGKLNRLDVDGFRFDTGPSLLTMPWVFRDLWRDCGADFDADVALRPLDPMCRYHWPDGATLDASPLLPVTIAGIRRMSPQDVPAFFAFMAHAARIYALTRDTFLGSAITGILDLCRRSPRQLARIPQLDAFRTVHRATSAFFRDPRLVQLFDRYATYSGSSPYRAPGTLNVVPWVEWGEGGWYVMGGLYRLAEALANLAQRAGANIQCGVEVREVCVERGRVGGVRLASGDDVAADAVVVNADAVSGTLALVPSKARQTLSNRRLNRLEPSMSGFILLLGVEGDLPGLAHHTIYFSKDYRHEFQQLVERLQPADDPTIYVSAPSITDPSQAPAGHHALFVMVNAPHTGGGTDWDAFSGAYRERILDKLAAMGLDVRGRIVAERSLSPAWFQQRFNAHRGSIYGISSNNRNTAFQRPPNRGRDVRGLYFAGGTAHPGGGLPLVALSGRHAADALLTDGV